MIQKWEYVTVPLVPHATKRILDSWGEQGYELVQVIAGPSSGEKDGFASDGYYTVGDQSSGVGLVAYMKRPKPGKESVSA